jgi:formylglycine-generating enzyme required for sulfatase activity
MIGEKLGDYEITATLGKGGFGSVFKALTEDGKDVAIKVLNPQALENKKVVKKFFHEAMIMAKLEHPHICKLMEFFPDGENYCIVIEYVEGVELKKVLAQQKGLLPLDIGLKIAKQCLEAFQYAHENGILHRDIKPANIMIDTHGNSKIMDFGIAKLGTVASHDTAASMLSVHYTPPERFDPSKEVDVRSDIYALGLVLYEMFAGKRAFNATETSQIMFCHLNEIPEPPSTFSENLPTSISDAISKSLEKDPEDRFTDFAEFQRALDPEHLAEEAESLSDEDMTILFDAADFTEALEPEKLVEIKEKKKKPMALIASIIGAIIIIGAAAGYFILKPAPEQAATGDVAVSGKIAPPAPEFFKPTEVKHPQEGAAMMMIPAGEFTMGSDKYSAEQPVQKIFLDQYYIDKYLVTNAQYQKFVEANGYETDAEKAGAGMVRIGRRWKKVPEANWKTPDGLSSIDGREDSPVSQVSYNDALSYCKWAGKDLPTEAQWEKAARGPEANEYPWGNEEPDTTTANFDNLVGTVTPVDKFEKGKSYYGVYDMAGNVYQWTKDWYAKGVQRNAKNPTGPESGKERVIKGGSFIEGVESLRSPNRDRYPENYSSFLFGFRCACKEIK